MKRNKTDIFIISDLHLSLSADKPMDVFGDLWDNYIARLKEAWCEKIGENDWVIIPGDISWAMTAEEAVPDLIFLNELPGKKVMMKGNHDYWWSSIAKLNQLKKDRHLDSLFFMHTSSFYIEECSVVVLGTRGWRCIGDKDFSEEDLKIYKRELLRFELSIKDAEKYDAEKRICIFHYPPFNGKYESSGFTDLMKKYKISECFYGHVHGIRGGVYKSFAEVPVSASVDGIDCRLISADYVNFSPVKIF
ncbi:MAG: metallophosphoesterase [Clostridia bacterium]|nr:metallophosphoesterase [Clostridia bacterium]